MEENILYIGRNEKPADRIAKLLEILDEHYFSPMTSG
jgi:hypothetical protein